MSYFLKKALTCFFFKKDLIFAFFVAYNNLFKSKFFQFNIKNSQNVKLNP